MLHKESAHQLKKTRDREEEEYVYQRNLTRQKERYQYNLEKELLEKELVTKRATLELEFATRESSLLGKEQEFQSLKQKADKFPQELQNLITKLSLPLVLIYFSFIFRFAQK